MISDKRQLKANVSAQQNWRDTATGSSSISIQLEGQSKQDILRNLVNAKRQGCIGVVVEIVCNQNNGRVTTPQQLQSLREVCDEAGLLLAVDETITAIRCGAPYAYQRPEFSHIPVPDLIFFGKALVVCGIGIHFESSFMRRFGIQSDNHRRQAITNWQDSMTIAIQLPLLIDAFGVL